jgi:GNAT superfamily N-acetyltransferase
MLPTVRRVLSDEGDGLRDVRLAALKESPTAFGSLYEDEARRTDLDWGYRARSGAAGVDRVTFFAVVDGDVVGLVGGYRPEANRSDAELVSMWTSPGARRAGVGRALVSAVIDWAREVAATSLCLWVTRGNEPALRLYESMGFRDTGGRQPLPSDPCKDEIRMTLAL